MQVEVARSQETVRFAGRKVMFGKIKKLHFVGIGGAGMSGIAEILFNLGYIISGSDTTPSDVTDYLSSLGITVHSQHSAANAANVDVVVISSAVSENNPEVIEARRIGIPVIKRSEMLGELMRLRFSIGIAGTHGKTTTTSMIGKILRDAGLEPTLIVGGVVSELGTGASLGEGNYLVTEVDEYDRSIYNAFPSLAVVLNIEPDHLDCYRDEADLSAAFLDYINRLPFYGSALLSADDKNINALIDRISRPYATFGFTNKADYRGIDLSVKSSGTSFSVLYRDDLLGKIELTVPGEHNAANALAAVAAARELEIPFSKAAEALGKFTGVGRRFELVDTVNGIVVIDDYAHHPTELRALLSTARQIYDGRIIVVFQPHLYSRTRDFLDDFVRELALADVCILTDIYPAREEPIEGISSDRIREEAAAAGHRQFHYVGKKESAIEAVAAQARPGDTILIAGAGSITHIRTAVVERLKQK